MMRGLPRRLGRISEAVAYGRLRLSLRVFAGDQDRRL